MLRMLYKNSKRRPTFDGSLVFVYETFPMRLSNIYYVSVFCYFP